MQHTVSDIISSPPKLTGTPFSAVSLPSDPSNQYKVNITPCSPLGNGCSALKKYFRIAADSSCCQNSVNVLCMGASNAFSRAVERVSILHRNIYLNLHRRIATVGALPGICGAFGKGFGSCLKLGAG